MVKHRKLQLLSHIQMTLRYTPKALSFRWGAGSFGFRTLACAEGAAASFTRDPGP